VAGLRNFGLLVVYSSSALCLCAVVFLSLEKTPTSLTGFLPFGLGCVIGWLAHHRYVSHVMLLAIGSAMFLLGAFASLIVLPLVVLVIAGAVLLGVGAGKAFRTRLWPGILAYADQRRPNGQS